MDNDVVPANPGPGWYPDPETPTLMRWWDGETWTEYTAPNAALKPANTFSRDLMIGLAIALGAVGLVAVAVVVMILRALKDWGSNK